MIVGGQMEVRASTIINYHVLFDLRLKVTMIAINKTIVWYKNNNNVDKR